MTTALLLQALSTLNNTVRVCAVIFYGHLVRRFKSMLKKPFYFTHACGLWCDAQLEPNENKNGRRDFFRAYVPMCAYRLEWRGYTRSEQHKNNTPTAAIRLAVISGVIFCVFIVVEWKKALQGLRTIGLRRIKQTNWKITTERNYNRSFQSPETFLHSKSLDECRLA